MPPFEEERVEPTPPFEGGPPHGLVMGPSPSRRALQDHSRIGALVERREDVDGSFLLPLRFTKLSDDEAVDRAPDSR